MSVGAPDLLTHPFVLFLLGSLAAMVGRVGEAAVRHVFADQKAHVEQTARIGRIEERFDDLRASVEQIKKQNAAIWRRLSISEPGARIGQKGGE